MAAIGSQYKKIAKGHTVDRLRIRDFTDKGGKRL